LIDCLSLHTARVNQETDGGVNEDQNQNQPK